MAEFIDVNKVDLERKTFLKIISEIILSNLAPALSLHMLCRTLTVAIFGKNYDYLLIFKYAAGCCQFAPQIHL